MFDFKVTLKVCEFEIQDVYICLLLGPFENKYFQFAFFCKKGQRVFWTPSEMVSMTQLFTQSVAHFTRPSSRPKTNNLSIKKILSLVVSSVKVVKYWTSF